jgi:hypothetical protein
VPERRPETKGKGDLSSVRNFVISLLLLCLVAFGCKVSEVNQSTASPTPPPKQNSASVPLKENINRQELTPTGTAALTNKLQVSPSPSPTTTNKKSNCDPNYTGCVPIASDVDCAGGKGNGPAYVDGPVRVIGVDKYDLDKDGDGIACEN